MGRGGKTCDLVRAGFKSSPRSCPLHFSICEMGLMTPAFSAGCEDGMRLCALTAFLEGKGGTSGEPQMWLKKDYPYLLVERG